MAKETAGPSGCTREHRLYESLVTVPGRGDLLGFKINGAGFAILARRIFAALTFANVRARSREEKRRVGWHKEEEVGSHKEKLKEIREER